MVGWLDDGWVMGLGDEVGLWWGDGVGWLDGGWVIVESWGWVIQWRH